MSKKSNKKPMKNYSKRSANSFNLYENDDSYNEEEDSMYNKMYEEEANFKIYLKNKKSQEW